MHDPDPGRDGDRRAAIVLALTATLVLAGMVAVTAVTGVAQEPFEVLRADYLPAIAKAAPALRLVIGLDALFLIAYATFFVVFPRALGVEQVPLVRLGVRVMLAVAVLDIVEDQHLLALARAARDGLPIDDGRLALQQVLSQVKFHLSYLALAAIALGLPRRDAVERAFAWSLGLPLPVAGAIAWMSPALEPAIGVGRWLAFTAGFVGAIVVLRRRGRGGAPSAVAVATGARA